MIRFLIETMTYIFGYIFQWRKINPASLSPTKSIRVNLGCGLAVCPGWINVDASLNALFASMPLWFIKILYHLSGSHRYYTQDEYCRLLKDHIFVFHDLSRSLPFKENTVDYFFSSHFFEHLFLQDATRLMKDCYCSLKPGGIIRIAVPDLKHAIDLYHQGDKKKMLENYFL